MSGAEEIAKLQRHLALLQGEYTKLQQRCVELENQLAAQASLNGTGDPAATDHFVTRILKRIETLFDRDELSDVAVVVGGRRIKCHKFVLAARGDSWLADGHNLASVDEFEITDMRYEVVYTMLKFVYTDKVEIKEADQFAFDLLTASNRFGLPGLKERTEKALMLHANERNCTELLVIADTANAPTLRSYCAGLIVSCWKSIPQEKFDVMPARLMYELMKRVTNTPLHMSIKQGREDIVFLFIVEFDRQLKTKLDERDSENSQCALDIALQGRRESIAMTLISHGCDPNLTDTSTGETLLHLALQRGDEYSAAFLIRNGASVNATTSLKRLTALHIATRQGMRTLVELLMQNNVDLNAQDAEGSTPLHVAISNTHDACVELLLAGPTIALNLRDNKERTALWLALMAGKEALAKTLVDRGVDCDAPDANKETLLHLAVRNPSMETAALFLIENGASIDVQNKAGETPLHLACAQGKMIILQRLLAKGADVNVADEAKCVPLHVALDGKHIDAVFALLDSNKCDLAVRNANDDSPLGLALIKGLTTAATRMVANGADVEARSTKGLTLLHQAILRGDAKGVTFLLENRCSINTMTDANETPLILAINHAMTSCVDALCNRGADVNAADANGIVPLWHALSRQEEAVAITLVRYKCDVDRRDNEGASLLHRAIRDGDEFSGLFLIGNGADVNAVCDGMTPLHMAAQCGMNEIIKLLLQKGATVNTVTSEGDSALHIAIAENNPDVVDTIIQHPGVDLSLRNNKDQTPFAVTVVTRNPGLAYRVLEQDPQCSEHFDKRGYNFLHCAVDSGDESCVQFLINLNVNVESRVRDPTNVTSLYLAVQRGLENITKHLLNAGADVNTTDRNGVPVLHQAAALDQPNVVSMLLERGVNVAACDREGNSALHVAVENRNVNCCRRLLQDSVIDVNLKNHRSQSALHAMALGAGPNSCAVFDLLLQYGTNVDINLLDSEGNSPLLLAFGTGFEPLCAAMVRQGAHVGVENHRGQSLMSNENRGRLQRQLLELIPRELPWLAETKLCQGCKDKFSVTKRKHHCRHCGRQLCSKCSCKEISIPKFDLRKAQRVCEPCYESLAMPSTGGGRLT